MTKFILATDNQHDMQLLLSLAKRLGVKIMGIENKGGVFPKPEEVDDLQKNDIARARFASLLADCKKEGCSVNELLQQANAAGATPAERTEIAMELYAAQKWSRGEARRFSGLSFHGFRKEQAKKKIPIHLSSDDLKKDVATLENLLSQ